MLLRLRATGLAFFALLSFAATACSNGSSTGGGGSGGAGTSTSTSTSGNGTGGATVDTTSSTGTGSATCAGMETTDLPGVHIELDRSQCTFSYADPMATITIGYEIVIDDDVTGVVARPQDAGQCDKAGPSGLIPFAKVDGNQQQYCLCDEGPCANPSTTPVTLKKGAYPMGITWDRHNWFGPSDTGNPEGPLFPVGDYTLTVSAIGVVGTSQTGFVITGTMPIHLVP